MDDKKKSVYPKEYLELKIFLHNPKILVGDEKAHNIHAQVIFFIVLHI